MKIRGWLVLAGVVAPAGIVVACSGSHAAELASEVLDGEVLDQAVDGEVLEQLDAGVDGEVLDQAVDGEVLEQLDAGVDGADVVGARHDGDPLDSGPPIDAFTCVSSYGGPCSGPWPFACCPSQPCVCCNEVCQ